MVEEELTYLRGVLLNRRREAFERLRQFESDWQVLGERDVEIEEEAQKADITSLYDYHDERSKEEIEAIDLALCRMAAGSYGICEECEELISPKRLEAIPEARLCVGCTRRYEKQQKRLRRPRELMPCEALPDEYSSLNDDELQMLILEHLRNDGRVDLEELEITCRKGMVYLEGALPSEGEHQMLLQILSDVMGLTTIVDLLGADEVAWEREDRTPGKDFVVPLEAQGLARESNDSTEDVFESMEKGIPYSPPGGPIPEEE
jgi:RNA polymerase-binding transcription factor DksA